jgi:hypothetical protein
MRNLSMFNLGLLLKALASNELTGRDLQLYELIVNYIETNSLYKESSIDEKAIIFLYIARIYYNNNNAQFPKFMRIL